MVMMLKPDEQRRFVRMLKSSKLTEKTFRIRGTFYLTSLILLLTLMGWYLLVNFCLENGLPVLRPWTPDLTSVENLTAPEVQMKASHAAQASTLRLISIVLSLLSLLGLIATFSEHFARKKAGVMMGMASRLLEMGELDELDEIDLIISGKNKGSSGSSK